jgi:hypothetical protein
LRRCGALCIPAQPRRGSLIDRRTFIRAGLAGSVVGTFGDAISLSIGCTAFEAYLPRRVALYDDRFSDCREFAAVTRSHGIRAHAILSNVTDVRYTNTSLPWASLANLPWATKPVAMAGLTAFVPKLRLQRLARNCGMRVLYEGVHHPLPRGRVEHAIWAPPERWEWAQWEWVQSEWAQSDWNLARATSWATSIAELIARIGPLRTGAPHFANKGVTVTGPTSTTPTRYVSRSHSPLSESAQPLHSWLLARVSNVCGPHGR